MYIHREIEQKIAPFLKRKEVLSFTGPRQAGKTTFIKHLEEKFRREGKKVRFLTFEAKSDLDLFDKNPEDFKKLAEQYDVVIIDEFQYATDAGKKLKYLYDTTPTKYIVTGSSSLELTFQTGKYMVGRLLDFEILPFSFREYLSFENKELQKIIEDSGDIFDFKIKSGFGNEINKRLSRELEKFVVWGGYPAVVLSKTEEEKKKVLEGIVEKYLLRDIQGLLHLATEDELARIGKFLAAQIGNLVKYQELSNISNLFYGDIIKHLNILQKTYIVDLLKPYYTNKMTELSKNPKSFFVDLGLRNYLLSDFRPLEVRNDFGAIMENYAFTAFRKRFSGLSVKFWRTKSKAEVDFVIEKERQIIPVEVKYSSKKIIGKSLFSFIEKFKPSKVIVLTKDLLSEEKRKNCLIQFIPLGYL